MTPKEVSEGKKCGPLCLSQMERYRLQNLYGLTVISKVSVAISKEL